MSLLLALAAMMCLSACSLLNLNKKEEAADSRNTYQIYYTNAEHSRLQSISYEPQEQTFEGLLSEMLDYFEQPDKLETDSYSVIPEGVKINGYTIGVDSLLIDFSGSYISMNNIEEILLRAGIVKTLVQLPGIYSISLTVDGQPLEEPASGQELQEVIDISLKVLPVVQRNRLRAHHRLKRLRRIRQLDKFNLFHISLYFNYFSKIYSLLDVPATPIADGAVGVRDGRGGRSPRPRSPRRGRRSRGARSSWP